MTDNIKQALVMQAIQKKANETTDYIFRLLSRQLEPFRGSYRILNELSPLKAQLEDRICNDMIFLYEILLLHDHKDKLADLMEMFSDPAKRFLDHEVPRALIYYRAHQKISEEIRSQMVLANQNPSNIALDFFDKLCEALPLETVKIMPSVSVEGNIALL